MQIYATFLNEKLGISRIAKSSGASDVLLLMHFQSLSASLCFPLVNA
jgi:hypothetical protein